MATKRKSSTRKKIQRTRTRSKSRGRAAVREKRKKTPRYVYYFGDGHADGAGTMKPLLGGKGANLHEMTRIGLPVPPGFTITTEVCSYFYDHNRTYPPQLEAQVASGAGQSRKIHGQKIRRQGAAVACFGALRRARFHARHDGHDPQPRDERRSRGDRREENEQRAVRLGFVSAFPADVRRRRHGRSETAGRRPRTVRDGDRTPEGRALRQARFPRRAD